MSKPMRFWSISTFVWMMVSLAFIVLFWMGQSAFLQDAVMPGTVTEAPGGVMGSIGGELRCPSNLSGIGPVWHGLQVGISTLDDLKVLYAPYGREPGILKTPFPYPSDSNEVYAPIYSIFVEWRDFRSELGLPRLIQVCFVDNTIAALSFYAEDDPTLPQNLEQLISLMGKPTDISWFEGESDSRMLHWPEAGFSVATFQGLSLSALYFYPFQGKDYEEHWPISDVLAQQPEYVLPFQVTVELENVDYESIEETLAVSPVWPTRTPQALDQTTTP